MCLSYSEYKNPIIFGGCQRSFGVSRGPNVKISMYLIRLTITNADSALSFVRAGINSACKINLPTTNKALCLSFNIVVLCHKIPSQPPNHVSTDSCQINTICSINLSQGQLANYSCAVMYLKARNPLGGVSIPLQVHHSGEYQLSIELLY